MLHTWDTISETTLCPDRPTALAVARDYLDTHTADEPADSMELALADLGNTAKTGSLFISLTRGDIWVHHVPVAASRVLPTSPEDAPHAAKVIDSIERLQSLLAQRQRHQLGKLIDRLADHALSNDMRDIDPGEAQQILTDAGLCVTRPVTAADLAANPRWAREYDMKPGDLGHCLTTEAVALQTEAHTTHSWTPARA